MTDFLHDDEQLQRYLDGELDPEERAAFESRLANEPDLQERLESRKLAIAAVQHQGTVELVRRIAAEEKTARANAGARLMPLRRTVRFSLTIAASLVFLLLAGGAVYWWQLTPEKLYGENFVDYQVAATRGTAERQSSIGQLYEGARFAEAVLQPAQTGEDSLLLGLAYLRLNQPTAAIRWFSPMALSQSSFRQDADYYLALAQLKSGQAAAALRGMEAIRDNPGHLYHSRVGTGYLRKLRMLSWK